MNLRRGILHELRFVEHQPRPSDALVLLEAEPEQRVGGHDDVGAAGQGRERLFGGGDRAHGERWDKPCGLCDPVGHDGGGGDDEKRGARPCRVCVRDQGECLQRLAETHVVGKNAAEPLIPEKRQPVEALFLVGPECGVDAGGERGRLNRIDAEKPRRRLSPRLRFERLVGEILKLRPEAGLVAADTHAGLPLGHGGGLIDEPLQFFEHRLVEREVRVVDQQHLRHALR